MEIVWTKIKGKFQAVSLFLFKSSTFSSDERNGFIEESQYLSMQSPDAKYESINLETYKPRTMFTKIKDTSKVDKRYDHKIPKEDGPAPGLYNIEDAIKKT
jgi:hypothetical protein